MAASTTRGAAAAGASGDGQRVAVLGGGLAGLAASLELVRRGCHVELYERSRRLGGKAGSDARPLVLDAGYREVSAPDLPDGFQSDHGYHVFPQWYTNMRALWAEIGLDPDVDVYQGMRYKLVPPAVDGRHQPLVEEPPPSLDTLLAIWELAVQPDRYVDRTTLQAFLYGLSYHDRDRPISFNDYVLNALTIGDRDLSARVVRNVFRQWLPVFAQPNWDGLKGSLQAVLIDPLERTVHRVADAHGGSFRVETGAEVTRLDLVRGGLRTRLRVGGQARVIDGCPTVIALPPEVLRTLYTDALLGALPELGNLHYLRANPFGALDIWFEGRLEHFDEPEHFTLAMPPGVRDHGITGFDISRHWPALLDGPDTVLQFVVADSRLWNGLSERAFTRRVVAEIARCIPEVQDPDRVRWFMPHSNQQAPLFVNDVDTWRHRPDARASLAGVYLAGDYTRHDTDVTSMEAAIRSGYNAAEALRCDLLAGTAPVAIQPPTGLPAQLLGLSALAEAEPTIMRMKLLEQIRSMLPG